MRIESSIKDKIFEKPREDKVVVEESSFVIDYSIATNTHKPSKTTNKNANVRTTVA